MTGLRGSVLATREQAERAAGDARAFLDLRADITRTLCTDVDPEFFPKWRMEPSPFIVEVAELEGLFSAASAVHGAVEALLDAWLAGDPGVLPYFARYEDLRRLCTKPGCFWQGWGRYDTLIDADGTPRFVETNAAMASGGLPNHYLAVTFDRQCGGALRPVGARGWIPQYDVAGAGRLLRRREEREATTEGALAILVDENRKFHESGMLVATLQQAGREGVLVGDVADVRIAGGVASLGGTRLRTTFNKFRMYGRQHHWSPGSFARNRAFLAAAAEGAFHPINCLAAQTIAEDKGILAAIRDPANAHLLTADQAQAVSRHTVATAVCEPRETVWLEGEEADLRERLEVDREAWMLKPRNDYRGAGIRSGREVEAAEWRAIVGVCFAEPGRWVAQHRVESLPVAAAVRDGDGVALVDLRLASGVYMIDGEPYGLVARAGYGDVVNGITGAHMLPIWVRGTRGREDCR